MYIPIHTYTLAYWRVIAVNETNKTNAEVHRVDVDLRKQWASLSQKFFLLFERTKAHMLRQYRTPHLNCVKHEVNWLFVRMQTWQRHCHLNALLPIKQREHKWPESKMRTNQMLFNTMKCVINYYYYYFSFLSVSICDLRSTCIHMLRKIRGERTCDFRSGKSTN